MRTILSHLIFSFFLCSVALGQPRDEVTVLLTVVEIDDDGERRAANKYVLIIPKDEGVATGFTNGQGQIKFQFASSESVTFRVGDVGDQVRLQPLSGRISQETSHLIDLRMRSDGRCQTCSAPEFALAPMFNRQVASMRDLIDDLKYQAGGRVMNQQSRDFAMSLRQQIVRITTPPPESDEFTRRQLREDRQTLVEALDDILTTPWKMKAGYKTLATGARLERVDPNGPAGRAGIAPNDVVIAVNGIPVTRKSQNLKWLIGNAPDRNVILTIEDHQSGRKSDRRVRLTR